MRSKQTQLAGTPSVPTALPRSIDDLDLAIRTLAREMSMQTYNLLLLVRELDDRCGWQKWGLNSCAEWLAWRCDLSLSAAREKVRTAHALRRMPEVSAAFASGRLSYSKVRALTRLIDIVDEASLLDYALRVSASQLEERCREIRNSTPESVGTAWRAWEHRSLIVSRDPGRGLLRITVEMPIEDGEVVAKAIERVADADADAGACGLEFAAGRKDVRDASDGSTGTPNSWRARQADALLAIARASLANGGKGKHHGAESAPSACESGAVHTSETSANHLVIVHTDDSALRGGIGRTDFPTDTMRRLTCDGSLVRVVEDHAGTPLAVGRRQRVVSTPLRRALWSRDRGCTFPGCRNRRYVDAHHVEHWAEGGATDIGNLMLLCSDHHRLVHEGGFTIRRDADERPYFVRPDGRVIPRSGYRLEDLLDDGAEDGEDPSAEVREGRGRWVVPFNRRRKPAARCLAARSG